MKNKTNKNERLFCPLIIIFCLAISACASEPVSGEKIFVDDFSSGDSGWNRQSNDDAYTRYLDGEYQIWLLKPNLIVWTTNSAILGDTAVQVAARSAGGPDNNFFGIVCRHVNDKNFYFFVISADSYYGIGKFKNGERVLLHNTLLDRNDKIVAGRATHHLRAECIGNTLSWVVDGLPLTKVTDPDFKEGHIGLIAGSYDKKFVDVRFDNLIISKP